MISRFVSPFSLAPLLLLSGLASSPTWAQPTNLDTPNQGAPMKWEKPELDKIVKADDLHISVLRDDGVNYGTPTFIWCVEVDGDLYVRAYNGIDSRWYQASLRQKAGRIIAAGKTREVAFEPVSGSINDHIDDAYRAKYSTSHYLAPMISERSRAATVRVLLRAGAQ
jgi:hypothetical protein